MVGFGELECEVTPQYGVLEHRVSLACSFEVLRKQEQGRGRRRSK
jgi:hypothetical protein